MRTVLKVLGYGLGGLLLLALAFYGWASFATSREMARTYETHRADFPIPFPLTAEELAELGIEADVGGAIALERARERGEHLVHARYGCGECHGANFGGGVMVDAFPIGTLLGPNLTLGVGSKILAYTASDWDRAVRHGVLPDGRGSAMPAGDFLRMSDQELSDIIAYIQSQPPVDNEVPAPTFGPLGKVLVATGQLPTAAALISDHTSAHALVPPPAEVTVDFGMHLAGVCTGCHNPELSGGRIAGGDPAWAPARNLTPHADGLAGWTYEQFVRALREGIRPDGSAILEPMTFVIPFALRMTEVELRALWTYLQSLPPLPTPG